MRLMKNQKNDQNNTKYINNQHKSSYINEKIKEINEFC